MSMGEIVGAIIYLAFGLIIFAMLVNEALGGALSDWIERRLNGQ